MVCRSTGTLTLNELTINKEAIHILGGHCLAEVLSQAGRELLAFCHAAGRRQCHACSVECVYRPCRHPSHMLLSQSTENLLS